jgi:hypothetical protein
MHPYTIIRLMKTKGGPFLAAFTALALSGCSLGQALGAESSSPSAGPSTAASTPPLPDYNARYGNNRVAAEAAVKVGRVLFAQQQYWEVYVKTDPAQPNGEYDPARPETFDATAREVQKLDLVLATESGPTIRTYATGGVAHETQVLTDAATTLQGVFTASTQTNVRVFYGEGSLHATATFSNGKLSYQPGPVR